MYQVILILVLLSSLSFTQDYQDVHYSIKRMEFNPTHNVIKIKVPGWLDSMELKEQVKKAVIWPNEPPPEKKTYIFIYNETDPIDERSNISCIYTPGKGFEWNLDNWKQTIRRIKPTPAEIRIYSTLVDSIISQGSSLSNMKIRKRVAKKYNINVSELDSIYAKVKYWWENYPRNENSN